MLTLSAMKHSITKQNAAGWTAVRVARPIASHLSKFVKVTGQTKTFVVTAALADYIDRHSNNGKGKANAAA